MDDSMLKSLCNLCTMCTIPYKLSGGQLQSSTQTAGKMSHPSSPGNTKEFWKLLGEKSPLQSCNQGTHLLPMENLPFVSSCKFISFNCTNIPHELYLI